jgi:hypothetical protein
MISLTHDHQQRKWHKSGQKPEKEKVRAMPGGTFMFRKVPFPTKTRPLPKLGPSLLRFPVSKTVFLPPSFTVKNALW